MTPPHRRLPPWLAPLAVLAVLLPPTPLGAQENDPNFGKGTHGFRFILHKRGFKALSSWRELGNDPSHTLLVFLGEPRGPRGPLLDQVPGRLSGFLDRGGAVLLASNQVLANRGEPLWRELANLCGCLIRGEPVAAWAPGDEGARREMGRFVYLGVPECIIPEAVDAGGPPLFWTGQPGGQKVSLRVATARPSFVARLRDPQRGQLIPLPEGAHVLARFPKGCWYGPRIGYLPPGNEPLTLAVSVEHGQGRLLLLASDGLFLNDMMRPDTNNSRFTINAVEWLQRGPAGKRDRVLFVVDGTIYTHLDALHEKTTSLIELEPRVVDWFDSMVVEIQDKAVPQNKPNDALITAVGDGPGRDLFGQGPTQNFYLLLVVAVAVGLVGYGIYRLRAASHASDPHVPLLATAVARQAPPASVLQQRTRYALQEDNLGEFARVLAQEWLTSALGQRWAGERPPRVVGPWGLRRLAQQVLRLARADEPEQLSQGAFRSLLAGLDRLGGALAAGAVRFE